MTFDNLTAEQQDHLFYALDWARSAAREYYLTQLGSEAPYDFELVLAEEYVQGLSEDTLDQIGMR